MRFDGFTMFRCSLRASIRRTATNYDQLARTSCGSDPRVATCSGYVDCAYVRRCLNGFGGRAHDEQKPRCRVAVADR